MSTKSIFRALAAVVAIAAAAFALSAARPADDEKNPEIARLIHENIERAGINTHPYEYRPAAETKVPKGYKPFYISHYGRHGSRSDWAGQKYPWVMEKYNRIAESGLQLSDGPLPGP